MEVRSAGCPLGAKCEEVKHVNGEQVLFRCDWYKQLRGKHPQTGDPVDHWGCAIAWMPILTIENTKESMETVAALNSFRNEMVRGQQSVLQMAEDRKVKEITDAHDDYRGR